MDVQEEQKGNSASYKNTTWILRKTMKTIINLFATQETKSTNKVEVWKNNYYDPNGFKREWVYGSSSNQQRRKTSIKWRIEKIVVYRMGNIKNFKSREESINNA